LAKTKPTVMNRRQADNGIGWMRSIASSASASVVTT
jgi:hypothetical protein